MNTICPPYIVIPVVVIVLLVFMARTFRADEASTRREPGRTVVSSEIEIEPLPEINKVALWQHGSKIGNRNMNAQDLQYALVKARARKNRYMVAKLEEALSYIQERN